MPDSWAPDPYVGRDSDWLESSSATAPAVDEPNGPNEPNEFNKSSGPGAPQSGWPEGPPQSDHSESNTSEPIHSRRTAHAIGRSDDQKPGRSRIAFRSFGPVKHSRLGPASTTARPIRLAIRTATRAVSRTVSRAVSRRAPQPIPRRYTRRSPIAPTQRDLSGLGARIFRGWGFDACSAPDVETMRAWRGTSRYGAVGVYIGGRGRSCGQPHLDRDWMREVSGMGWQILPVYVGSQSPCVTTRQHRRHRIDPRHAYAQGRAEAADAVRAAAGLGIAPRSPVYLDVESYYPHTGRCAEPVINFAQAWSRGMRAEGYLPGFYSSSNSGITGIEAARRSGRSDMPDLVWFARWGQRPDVYAEPALPRAAWRPHRRIHQFDGEATERHAGRALRIDRDLVDAPVAIVVPPRWW